MTTLPPPPIEPLSVEESIEQVSPDLDAKDYVISMIKEEPPLGFSQLYELIGDFMTDYCDGNEEKSKNLTWEILGCLVGMKKYESIRAQEGPNANNNNNNNNDNDDDDDEDEDNNDDDENEEDTQTDTYVPPAPEANAAAGGKKLGEMLGSTGHEDVVGFQDDMLGVGEKYTKSNYNEVVAIGDLVKARRAKNTKDRAAQVLRMKQWQNQKVRPPAPVKIHRGLEQIGKVTDVIIDRFGVTIGGKELIQDTTLKIVIGRRYGLHGRNGTGKTCLLASLAKKEHPKIPKHVHIVTVEQEHENIATSDSPLYWVLQVDSERSQLEETIKSLEAQGDKISDSDSSKLIHAQTRWEEIEGDHAPHLASQILEGLGFDSDRQNMPTERLSGGWRARVALARALFAEPDILLLDEPTNHLDVHAVTWLTEFLKNYDRTIIMVSHARDVLNEVCTDITHLNHQKLSFYRGNFDTFEILYSKEKAQLAKQHEKQEAQRAHMQAFVDKFRYNAKRASMAQSRIKALNKLPLLDEILSDPTLTFQFKDPEPLPTPILQLDAACFEYSTSDGITGKPFYLNDLSINFDLESRVCLVGENGSGKSTLLKLLVGDHDKMNIAGKENNNKIKSTTIDENGSGDGDGNDANGTAANGHGGGIAELYEAKSGIVRRHNRLRIGYFNQHHMDSMDLMLNSIQNLMEKYPKAMNLGEEAARNWLGQFGVIQSLAVEPLYVLSGGQKSRVALAMLAYSEPHIIVLDEPTNHLDLDAIQALIAALTSFKGGVILVSHDSHFIESVCDEIWNVEGNTCKKFGGDIVEYRNFVLKRKREQERMRQEMKGKE